MGGVTGGYGSYTCGVCGAVLPKERDDAATMAEAGGLFGAEALAGGVMLVCGDCWPGVLERARAMGVLR